GMSPAENANTSPAWGLVPRLTSPRRALGRDHIERRAASARPDDHDALDVASAAIEIDRQRLVAAELAVLLAAQVDDLALAVAEHDQHAVDVRAAALRLERQLAVRP